MITAYHFARGSAVSLRIFLVSAMICSAGALAAQQPPRPAPLARPIQVTDSAVARGRALFHGSANCVACHGVEGAGTDSGPALAQGVWLHGPDTFEGILDRVVHGVPESYSTRGLAMPMRGWNQLSDTQARDVAAYVWEVSHRWQRRRPPGS
jgi:mono/diheme cytochrome c family protein